MTYIKRRRTKYYGAAAKVDPNYDTHVITATSAIALTLINPVKNDTGKVLRIVSKTAYAHTVTVSGGFGADSNQATYTMRGNVGDTLEIEAIDGYWYITNGGYGSLNQVQDYTASGAIDTTYDLHTISVDGVGAMTLADPVAADEGRIVTVVGLTANAHTITNAGGFGGGGTGEDVVTMSGVIGDAVSFRAIGLQWFILNHQVSVA